LTGVLLIGPSAFAQRDGHQGPAALGQRDGHAGAAAGSRGFSGEPGRTLARPGVSGRAFPEGRAYYGGGYGGYYASPRVGLGLGYGPSCYPGYPCPGYGPGYATPWVGGTFGASFRGSLGGGYHDRIGYGARFGGEVPRGRGEALGRSGRRSRPR
jgi:hypothetical protein